MSATYSVTLSNVELEAVTIALGYAPAAKLVKPRATVSVAAPIFDTGDDRLDAFMRRTWKPSDAVKAAARAALPKPAGLSKPRQRTAKDRDEIDRFNEAAVKAWRALGHRVEIKGDRIDPDGSNVTIHPLGE